MSGIQTSCEQALDDLHVDLDHLIKLVEDRALETLDDTGLVGFLQGFERLRNRLPLIDHQMINSAACGWGSWAIFLCVSSSLSARSAGAGSAS